MIVAIVLAFLALAMRFAVGAPAREIPAEDRAELEGIQDIEDLDELLADLDELTDRAGPDEWEPVGFESALEATEPDDVFELDEDDSALEDLGALGDPMRAEQPLRSEPRRSRSPIGRIDLSLVYRHSDPISSEHRDEIWLVGTWRR
jgi:hypothetical protein